MCEPGALALRMRVIMRSISILFCMYVSQTLHTHIQNAANELHMLIERRRDDISSTRQLRGMRRKTKNDVSLYGMNTVGALDLLRERCTYCLPTPVPVVICYFLFLTSDLPSCPDCHEVGRLCGCSRTAIKESAEYLP